jgi:hypothetical protein
MSVRTFSVLESCGLYKISISQQQPKRSKLVKNELQGYLSMKAAKDDIQLVKDHLNSGKRIASFTKNLGEATSSSAPIMKKSNEKQLYGAVAKAVEKLAKQKYNTYCKNLRKGYMVPNSRSEWEKMYNSGRKDTSARAFRAISRDPHTRYLYLINGMESLERKDNIKAMEESVKYMKERRVTLGDFIKEEGKIIDILQKAVYTSTCFSLLLKAKLEEDEEVEFITEDSKFTNQNTSKLQQAKVNIQCMLTLSLSNRLTERAKQELELIRVSLELLSNSEKSFEQLKEAFTAVLQERNDFKVQNSMTVLVERVHEECRKIKSQKTIRKWYNEVKEYGLFKEDLRGCFQRISFLEEYNYTRKFQLYLRNEKHLTVDEAKRNLECILNTNPPETEKGKIALADLLPLSRSTVHRWMLQAGCKYEKASVSYYTDSHELESTKQDFINR